MSNTIGNDAELIAAAVAGQSLSRIAAAAGVSVSTAQRRLRQPEVQAAIRDEGVRLRREATARLGSLRSDALDRLAGLIGDDDPRTSIRAVSLVLASSARFDHLYDLDIRIAALEHSASLTPDGSTPTSAEEHDDDQ